MRRRTQIGSTIHGVLAVSVTLSCLLGAASSASSESASPDPSPSPSASASPSPSVERPRSLELMFRYHPKTQQLVLTHQRGVHQKPSKHRDPSLAAGRLLLRLEDESGRTLYEVPIVDPTIQYADWLADDQAETPGLLTGRSRQLSEGSFLVVIPFDERLARAVLLRPSEDAVEATEPFDVVGDGPIEAGIPR